MKRDGLSYFSSFGPDLFEASGGRCLATIGDRGCLDKTFVFYEGPIKNKITAFSDKIHVVNLDKDEFLQTWLHQNRAVIPDYLGGMAKPCGCPNKHIRHARHRRKCHWSWMNRNASRWFRKVASFRLMAKLAPTRFIVWLDADCRLLKPFTPEDCRSILGGSGIAYCRGHRPAIESGVLIFDLENTGPTVIERLCKRYTTRRYLQDERWDDGFQLTRIVLDELPKTGRDLVHPSKWRGLTNDVIPTTVLAEFVAHDKGRHGNKLDIMK